MKTLVRTTLLAAGLSIVSAAAVSAQISDTMKFTTTFPFTVEGRTMPAGSYTITPLELDRSLMEISNGRTAVLMLTEPDTLKGTPKQDQVIFDRHGDTYVLREIWDASSVTGAEAVEPHAKSAHKAR